MGGNFIPVFSCPWHHWNRNLWEEPEQLLTGLGTVAVGGGNSHLEFPRLEFWALKSLQCLFPGTGWDKFGINPLKSILLRAGRWEKLGKKGIWGDSTIQEPENLS